MDTELHWHFLEDVIGLSFYLRYNFLVHYGGLVGVMCVPLGKPKENTNAEASVKFSDVFYISD